MNTEAADKNTAITGTNDNSNPFSDFGWDQEEVSVVDTINPPKEEKKKTVVEDPDDDDLEEGQVLKTKSGKKVDEVDDKSAFADFEDEVETLPKDKKTIVVKEKKKEGDADPNENGEAPEEEEEDDDFFTTLAGEMKAKGIFTVVEVPKDRKITEDQFFELQEAELEGRAEEMIVDLITDLKEDPDAAALLKYVKAGGSSKEFFKTFANAASNIYPEDYDLSKPANQEEFLRFYLKTHEGMDATEVEDKLEWYTEKGKTEDMATKYHTKLVASEEKAKANLVKNQLAAQEAQKQKNEKWKANLQAALNEVDEIGDFTFTAKDKKELVPFMTKPSVKVGENQYTTPFQVKMKEIMADPKKLLVLLKLVSTDFDTKELKKTTTTKVVEGVKSTLRDKKPKELSNKGARARSLADHFDD